MSTSGKREKSWKGLTPSKTDQERQVITGNPLASPVAFLHTTSPGQAGSNPLHGTRRSREGLSRKGGREEEDLFLSPFLTNRLAYIQLCHCSIVPRVVKKRHTFCMRERAGAGLLPMHSKSWQVPRWMAAVGRRSSRRFPGIVSGDCMCTVPTSLLHFRWNVSSMPRRYRAS